MESLLIELMMLKTKYPSAAVSIKGAFDVFRELSPDVRFAYIQKYWGVRILLVIPSSSCEAERSFSALRRLKTCLHESTTQKRLKYIAVCNVHKDILENLPLSKIV
ncbi:hypothetical protein PR048_013741 [Dryococelus australis]|uniref:HAT C-terminal dimerisation domain-containing protein n=1 Tax=Dryococelus australis TaxID=614101 RepID=A0ABQ9HTB0_9NEOP|nr:hypothetical protein PR048_013741 [Dryococelus australis]